MSRRIKGENTIIEKSNKNFGEKPQVKSIDKKYNGRYLVELLYFYSFFFDISKYIFETFVYARF